MLLNILKLVLELSPNALLLLIVCIFLLTFVLLLIIAFSPTGAVRFIWFAERIQHLFAPQRKYSKWHSRRLYKGKGE